MAATKVINDLHYNGKHVTDLAQEYGDDWIFGQWSKQEPEWLLAVYNSVEG